MKKIIYIIGIILMLGLVSAFSFVSPGKLDWTNNPWTMQQQYVRSGNYSGENITADYLFANGSQLNVNNSNYLQGYTPTTLKNWIQELFNSVYCELTGCEMTGNLTTTGNITAHSGMFDYIDKIEQESEPATPSANTLRLYVEDYHGFSIYKFKDEGGMIRELVRDSVFVVKNDEGSTINKMQAVYDCGSSSNVPLVCLAKADNISTMPSIGIAIEAFDDGEYGRIMQVGLLEGINTATFAEGDVLYVADNVSGGLTNIAPITPNLTQEIGTVLVSGAAGKIQIISRALTGDEFGTINNFTVAEGHYFIGDGSNLYNVNYTEQDNFQTITNRNSTTTNNIQIKNLTYSQKINNTENEIYTEQTSGGMIIWI